MAEYVLFQVEGVLADVDPQSFAASKVNVHGKLLFYGLSHFFKVALTHNQKENIMDHWLLVNGVKGETLRILAASPTEALRRLRSDHGDVGYTVVSTPTEARSLLREGCPTLTYTRPTYARGEWRPDHDDILRGWDEVVKEVDEQQRLRDADERVTADVDRRWEQQ